MEAKAVEEAIQKLRMAAWEPAPAVGEGCEYRVEETAGVAASALTHGDSLIHCSWWP